MKSLVERYIQSKKPNAVFRCFDERQGKYTIFTANRTGECLEETSDKRFQCYK
ncbi:TPA: hypothetical protein QC445_005172 [Bacillus cereus]|nr:hypothetical protein [Bacillus cereus]